MLMWNEKILTTIPRDHPLSGERSFTLHWKKHFTELFTPSLAFDVKENAIASLLWMTRHLLLSGAPEASLPPGVGMASFPGLISHFKREFSGIFFCKDPAYTLLFQEVWSSQSFATMVQYSLLLKLPSL